MPFIPSLLAFFRTLTQDRSDLVLENLALRQQLAVLQRAIKHPKILPSDRLFWVVLSRTWKNWRSSIALVKPETVVRWHQQAFKAFWRWKSRGRKPGRPRTNADIIALIRRIAQENPTWGAPHVQSELALLGYHLSDTTVAKYMGPRPPRGRSQGWITFLRNHLMETAGCDFFVVPTVTFQLLRCFLILSHDRRRILHLNVTPIPTEQWTAQQIIEAFPGDGPVPGFLVRDRDPVYGGWLRRRVRGMGIREVITGRKSPWQNPFAERAIGSVRRDCLDHVIVLNETHLRRILKMYVAYYNEARPHLSLNRNSPFPRKIDPPSNGRVIALPYLGGPHHAYKRAA